MLTIPEEEALAHLEAAGRRMEEAARLEGIDDHTPLAHWVRAQRAGMDAVALLIRSHVSALRNSHDGASDMHRRAHIDITSLTQHVQHRLEEGIAAVHEIRKAADQARQTQVVLAERAREATVNRMVEGIAPQIRESVLHTLKGDLGREWKRFIWSVDMRTYCLIGAIASGVLLVGVAVGIGLQWRDAQLGRRCSDSNYVVLNPETGHQWCWLPNPTTSADGQESKKSAQSNP